MDDVDREILEYLREDGRASFTEIASKVGVSEGTVRNRVNRMLENGVIERFTIDVNPESQVEAFQMVDVSTDADIGSIVDQLPEDLEAYELAGDYDLMLKISRPSSPDINRVLDTVRAVEGVESTRTYMVLENP